MASDQVEPSGPSSRHAFYFLEIPSLLRGTLPSSRMLTDRGGFVRVMFPALESLASAYIGWQTRPPLRREVPCRATGADPLVALARNEVRGEYGVVALGSRRVIQFSQFDIARDDGLNAFGEVAMARITSHPFCKLSTSLVLSLYLSLSLPLGVSFSSSSPLCLSFSLSFSVSPCVSPHPRVERI